MEYILVYPSKKWNKIIFVYLRPRCFLNKSKLNEVHRAMDFLEAFQTLDSRFSYWQVNSLNQFLANS